MIYDVWVKVLRFLEPHHLMKFRSTSRFIYWSVENELTIHFEWYRFHKQLIKLPDIPIWNLIACSKKFHFVEIGCTFQIFRMQNDVLLKITDYLGENKFLKFESHNSYVSFDFYFTKHNLSFLLFGSGGFTNNSFLFDIKKFTITKTDLWWNDLILRSCATVEGSVNSFSKHNIIHEFVTIKFYKYSPQSFKVYINDCLHSNKNCEELDTKAKNNWLFRHEQHNCQIFFHVWYDKKTNEMKSNLVHQIFVHRRLNNYAAIYFQKTKVLSIIEIGCQLKWKIIKDINIYCDEE